MWAIKGRHGGRLRRHGHWGHILTFDTPPHPRPVDIPKFPGVGASPAPLNPRTTYGLIAIIPSVSRSANNPKSTNPPEPCASVVAFSLVDHATIQFLARHPSSAREGKATSLGHPPSGLVAICHFPSVSAFSVCPRLKPHAISGFAYGSPLSSPRPRAPGNSAGQFVTGLRWQVGRPIEHLPTFARSFLGPGVQIGIGQNSRRLGRERLLHELRHRKMPPLGSALNSLEHRIWNNNAHYSNCCKSSLGVNRSIPMSPAGCRWALLKVTMQSASAVEANSSTLSSSGSEDNGRRAEIRAWRTDTKIRSSRKAPISSELKKSGTSSRWRTSSYSRTTAADRCSLTKSPRRTICTSLCEAPFPERRAATITLVSTTIFTDVSLRYQTTPAKIPRKTSRRMDLLCSLRGDFLDHGEEVVEEAAPGFEFAQPGALEFGVGPRSVERIRLNRGLAR